MKKPRIEFTQITRLMMLADARIVNDPANAQNVRDLVSTSGIDVPEEPSDTYNSRVVEAVRSVLEKSGNRFKIPVAPKAA